MPGKFSLYHIVCSRDTSSSSSSSSSSSPFLSFLLALLRSSSSLDAIASLPGPSRTRNTREMPELNENVSVNTNVVGTDNESNVDAAGSERSSRQHGDTKKRPADTVVEDESNKRAREDEGRKVTVSGLKGMGQEFVQNHLDRAGLPYLKAWKQRKQDTATVWFPDDPVILRVNNLYFGYPSWLWNPT